ncbi:MAG TPA: hypothetical protein DHW45_20765 [Candidatus Latescibacteria bacterium]|nr:hypothetical protein [Candidatus Latescibacterota bacterium]
MEIREGSPQAEYIARRTERTTVQEHGEGRDPNTEQVVFQEGGPQTFEGLLARFLCRIEPGYLCATGLVERPNMHPKRNLQLISLDIKDIPKSGRILIDNHY